MTVSVSQILKMYVNWQTSTAWVIVKDHVDTQDRKARLIAIPVSDLAVVCLLVSVSLWSLKPQGSITGGGLQCCAIVPVHQRKNNMEKMFCHACCGAETGLLLTSVFCRSFLPSCMTTAQWDSQEPSNTERHRSTTKRILTQPSCKTAIDWLQYVFLEGFDSVWDRNND